MRSRACSGPSFWSRRRLLHAALGFVLFRLFDILKPFPARFFQERLPGGYGVVADDLAAAVYAAAVLQLLMRFGGI